MRIAVVTGASSGMGREFVYQISNKYKNIDEIWIIARRRERLEEVANKVSNKKIRILPLDLTVDADIQKYKDLLASEKPEVKLLVNSSGLGKIGRFDELSIEDNCLMVDLNCSALIKMTHITIPFMIENSNIVNLASSAAFLPQPEFAIYAASKSFVLSFSKALGHELQKKSIFVTSICPGPVKTEFFDLAEKTGSIKLYKKIFMSDPKKVVEQGLFDAYKKKSVSIYGISMKMFYIISKIVPHRLLLLFFR